MNEIKSEESTGIFFKNTPSGLMARLNAEGQALAVEYMEYLVSTGRYSADDKDKTGHLTISGGSLMP